MKDIPTPQLVKVPDHLWCKRSYRSPNPISPAHLALPEDQRQQEIWQDFLRVQLKPHTRQEYGKALNYFCRSTSV